METQTKSAYNHLIEASKLEYLRKPLKMNIESEKESIENFSEVAFRSYLAPVFSKTIKSSCVPNEVFQSFTAAYHQVLARNIALQNGFVAFAKKLNDASIPLIPLKGIYLSEIVYKDLGLRHLSDIDVLVKSEHVELICELMHADNWEVKATIKHSKTADKNFKHAHPFTFIKNGVVIELHTHLYNQNECAVISESDIWNHAKTETFLTAEIHQFDAEFLVQYLCLHLHKHLIGNELKLVNFCDIREFLTLRKNTFDWQRFAELNKKYRCINSVNQVMFLLHKHWKVELPEGQLDFGLDFKLPEEKFWNFLTGKATETDVFLKNRLERKEREVGKLSGTNAKTRYIIGQVFPKRSFVERRYQLKPNAFLAPWYCVRVFELGGKFLRAKF